MKKTPTAKIVNRCDWCGDDPLYQKYHDEEWGVPTFDDKTLFEFLILEGAQAGLSWITVLRKRENYRKAFHQFNPEKIARYSENKIQRLKLDAGIIRNDLKIRSAVSNAQCYIELCNEKDSLSNYLWNFVEGKPIKNHWQSMKTLPANTPLSDTISKDLKKRGFKFVGSTIIYAYMQSMGLVNDHLTSCHCYDN
jgi:DNA-3-methyladenine glycosylase I